MNIEVILEQVKKETEELFRDRKKAKKLSDLKRKEVPVSQGVYLIQKKNNIVVYVGKGKNLRRRLDDHCSGETRNTTSGTFRDVLSKTEKTPFGKGLKKHIGENYYFSWIEIEDSDVCHLIEALSIVCARRENPSLFNK